MTVAGEVVATIRAMADDAGSVLMDVAEFFAGLPADLDLASAEHYLHKEFNRNDTGIDNRVGVYIDADDYDDYSGYDADEEEDEDASWREDYY